MSQPRLARCSNSSNSGLSSRVTLSLSTRGTTLGNYEVSVLLGKGGMGEVWRASDTRLGRDVAIEALPPEFSEDVDRLSRFEREAKVLASLNHPHIAAIYGLEASAGTRLLSSSSSMARRSRIC